MEKLQVTPFSPSTFVKAALNSNYIGKQCNLILKKFDGIKTVETGIILGFECELFISKTFNIVVELKQHKELQTATKFVLGYYDSIEIIEVINIEQTYQYVNETKIDRYSIEQLISHYNKSDKDKILDGLFKNTDKYYVSIYDLLEYNELAFKYRIRFLTCYFIDCDLLINILYTIINNIPNKTDIIQRVITDINIVMNDSERINPKQYYWNYLKEYSALSSIVLYKSIGAFIAFKKENEKDTVIEYCRYVCFNLVIEYYRTEEDEKFLTNLIIDHLKNNQNPKII